MRGSLMRSPLGSDRREGGDDFHMASVQAEIGRLLNSQSEAMRAKDIDRLMSHYSRDIVYFDVVPPLQFVGTSALRARFLQWFESWRARSTWRSATSGLSRAAMLPSHVDSAAPWAP